MKERRGKEPNETNKALIAMGEWMGLAFLLPSAIFIGYIAGGALDRWLGTNFLYIVFMLFGIAGGILQIVRKFTKESK